MSAFMWPLYVLTSHTPTVSYDAAEFSDRTVANISRTMSSGGFAGVGSPFWPTW